MKSLDEIKTIQRDIEEELLSWPGVTGVGLGYKQVGCKITDELAIRVYVQEKGNQAEGCREIPSQIQGVVTDVIESKLIHFNPPSTELYKQTRQAAVHDPLKGGISIGPCRTIGVHAFVGTLGAIALDNTNNDELLLSAYNVFCGDNNWKKGDEIAQPSRLDCGKCPDHVVATLLNGVLTSNVDCAVAKKTARNVAREILDIGAVAGVTQAKLGMKVRKSGRSTGVTYGVVDDVNRTVKIDYGDGIGIKTLVNQISIRPDTSQNKRFGDVGDNGAAIVTENREIVGLYCITDQNGYGIANHIQNVTVALNIKIAAPVVQADPLPWLAETIAGPSAGYSSCNLTRRDKNGGILATAGPYYLPLAQRPYQHLMPDSITPDPTDGGVWVMHATGIGTSQQVLNLTKIKADGTVQNSKSISMKYRNGSLDSAKRRFWLIGAPKLMVIDAESLEHIEYTIEYHDLSIAADESDGTALVGLPYNAASEWRGILRSDKDGETQFFTQEIDGCNFLRILPGKQVVCSAFFERMSHVLRLNETGKIDRKWKVPSSLDVTDIAVDPYTKSIWVLLSAFQKLPTEVRCLDSDFKERITPVNIGNCGAYCFWSIAFDKYSNGVWLVGQGFLGNINRDGKFRRIGQIGNLSIVQTPRIQRID